MSHKKYTDLVNPSDENLARINPKTFLVHTSIVNLNIDTLFVDIDALGVEILMFKGQICLDLQPEFWRFLV